MIFLAFLLRTCGSQSSGYSSKMGSGLPDALSQVRSQALLSIRTDQEGHQIAR